MIVRKSYYFKKYIVHALVAGAMVVSWGTVFHVNNYVHSHVKTTRGKTKTEAMPEDLTPTVSGTSPSPQAQTAATATPTHLPPKLTQMAPVVIPKAILDSSTATTAKDAVKKMESVVIATAASSTEALTEMVKAPPMNLKVHIAPIKSEALTSAIAQKAGISITQTNVDTNFIRKVEGSVLKGYVPLAATTRSGVTIGDGFDLGQLTKSEFDKLPLSETLKKKLSPYVGLIKFKAKAFLHAHPLTIDEQELKEVNIIAANKILAPLLKKYNHDSKVSFQKIPGAAQTVIFSYAYQHGPGFMYSSSGKRLWNCFITQNWHQASSMLHGARQYKPRRDMEARLLDGMR
jgi:Bacterial toxin homologue of phage lysozyme, C-term